MANFVLAIHFTLLALLCVFGWHRLHLVGLYRRHRSKLAPRPDNGAVPTLAITVQLPVYNEKFVVERLVNAACALRYPPHLLEIQVLDDSTDETTSLVAERVRHFRKLGHRIEHIRRYDRVGFKAGALEEGLKTATGELIAIFDADFVPEPDLLLRAVPEFTDGQVGMVQMRWGHLNRDFSALTQVQAILLDAHFMIEHGGRAAAGRYFNFNGTAGIWRAAAISDAGGWQHDTLTEDLDLSYRAQMRDWRFRYLPDAVCAGELPTEMSAFKTQQHRWAKGMTQVMLKLLSSLWLQPAPLATKVEATFHLASNCAYLLMVLDSVVFLVPSVVIRHQWGWSASAFVDLPIFFFASVCHVWFFLAGQQALFGSSRGRKRYLPALLSLGVGLGITNARGVLEALAGRQSAFVRTPKRGADALSARPAHSRERGAYHVELVGWEYLELALGLFYAGATAWAVQQHLWATVPVFLLFQNGFLFAGIYALIERRRQLDDRRVAAGLPSCTSTS